MAHDAFIRGKAMNRSLSVVRVSTFVFVSIMAGLSAPAHARLTRINAGAPVLIDLPAFGRTGAYLKIAGTFEGELDPTDRRNAAIADIELAPLDGGKVHYTSTFFLLRPVYSIASIEHNTTFDRRPEQMAACQQLTNPLYNGPIFRALSVRLDRWVTRGIRPPPSRVAKRSHRTLVSPGEVNFPAIPATAYAGWPELPAVQFNPGVMNHNAVLDFSVVPPEHVDDLEYTVQIAQVDADGNDIAGIRLPYLAVPLGTHTGWSLLKPGMGGPDICGQNGQFIPVANTRAERLAFGDPRPSIEERYRNHRAYVNAVSRAAERLVREGFLLHEDEDRIVTRAARQGTDLWKMSP